MLPNDPLTAAVIGGLLTALGTFVAALLIRRLDIGRENRRLGRQVVGAINTVLAEMAANSAILKRHLDAKSTYIGELPVSSEAYRRVDLILAEQLDLAASQAVFEAYAPIETGDLYAKIEIGSASEAVVMARRPFLYLDLNQCADTIAKLEAAGEELRRARAHIGGQWWRRQVAAQHKDREAQAR
jgi:hypothetical protein